MDPTRKVVLIVDDEPGMRDMLRWSLGGEAFDVALARDGEEASALIAAGGVDLVVTDITMPRLGGFAVLEAAGRAGTPVIMMTGFGTVEMAVHALRRGASDFLLKPFDAARLAERIGEALRRPDSPGPRAPS
ncbi:MAG: response regulator [Elusimicrobia bacterium]|nr:response regulator [Elusimicrobiota bacterium]